MNFVPQTVEAIAVKVLPRPARGVWIATSGVINFKDAAGVAQTIPAACLLAGNQYTIAMTEITSGTAAVGLVLY